MAAVTQLSPNFLGGVSRQTDDKKLDGQVVDITNGYPDPTYGLVKRASTAFLWTLNKADGTPFEDNELEDAFWFHAETKRTVTEDDVTNNKYPGKKVGDIIPDPYICAIKNANVHVWSSLTGEPQTVENSAAAYLTRPGDNNGYYSKNDFHARTILDSTIICNRRVVTEMVKSTDSALTPNLVGTIRLEVVIPETDYIVLIDGQPYKYQTTEKASADGILKGLAAAIPAEFNPTVYKTSVEISRSTPFILDTRDSAANNLLSIYQDVAATPDVLALPTKPGRLVEISGDEANNLDNYYLEFEDNQWTETIAPGTDVEIKKDTMPHRLFFDDNKWKFGPIDYVNRLVGDNESNNEPSFIGNPINSSFYYNNRLGFLSGANIILSQAKDVFNFFGRSQLTLVDSDPIDINANSTRPVELYEVVTQQQGILVFGTRQQFWLSSPDTGILTPTRSTVRTICSYESDINISPLDIGTTIGFVSKTPDYSKLMILQGQGEEVDPIVVEISRVVTGWLPNSINGMAVSPQNSFVALTSSEDRNLYIYRFYNDGREDRMQAWTKWEMPGEVQALNIVNDIVFSVTKQSGRYCTTWITLNALDKSGPQLSNDEFKPGTPYLDFMSSPKLNDQKEEMVTYDSTTDETFIYTKFPLITDRDPIMVLTLPADNSTATPAASQIDLIERLKPLPRSTDDDPGYWLEAEQGVNETGTYFKVKGDVSGYAKGITIGYSYDFEVILPKFYYKIAAKNNAADYTAHLNVNRVKIAVGQTGAVKFKVKAFGSEEWVDIHHVTDADYYLADTDPLKEETVFTVPINQRNKNFQLKVTSDLPFPVSLVSMMWEGQYTPRFYRRT